MIFVKSLCNIDVGSVGTSSRKIDDLIRLYHKKWASFKNIILSFLDLFLSIFLQLVFCKKKCKNNNTMNVVNCIKYKSNKIIKKLLKLNTLFYFWSEWNKNNCFPLLNNS